MSTTTTSIAPNAALAAPTATPGDELDPTTIRHVFGEFPSGVAVLAIDTPEGPQALVASSFLVGVSLDPPLVAVAVQESSQTWPALRDAPAIGISYLGQSHEGVLRQLAGRDRAHRFDGVAVTTTGPGALFLQGSPVRLETTVHHVVEAGDHQVAFLEVQHAWESPENPPVIWHHSSTHSLA